MIEAQQYFMEIPLAKIYAPTLKRTTETAEIISSGIIAHPKVVAADEAKTWNMGFLVGSLKKPNKPVVNYFMNHPDEAPTGGESMNSFQERFLPWIKEREEEVDEKGKPILIILSGSNLRALGVEMYDDRIVLDLDEGGVACLKKQDGKWTARVIFGHKDDEDERIS